MAEFLPQSSEYCVALEEILDILSDDPFQSIEANASLFAGDFEQSTCIPAYLFIWYGGELLVAAIEQKNDVC